VERIFPDLATTGYDLTITVQAPRHLALVQTIPVPAGSLFPIAPLEINLDYEPVRLQGHIVKASDNSLVEAAQISLQIPNTLALRTPLHFDHPAGTMIRACAFTTVGAARTLTQTVVSLSDRLLLSDAAGLNADDILRLGHPHQWEYVVIDGPGAQPSEVCVRGGLRRTYPADTPVQPVSSSLSAGTLTLMAPVKAGASLLPISSPLAADHISIQDADPARVEFHTLGVLSSSQPEDPGSYRLDGIQGVSSLKVHAQDPGGTHTADAEVQINPAKPVHILNLRLSAP
jgi:hypothetical protein